MEELFVSTLHESERDTENILRPQRIADYVGQDKAKNNLAVFIKAA